MQRIIEVTDARIVVSSSWRYLGLETLQRMWHDRNLPGSIVGITPLHTDDDKLLEADLSQLDVITADMFSSSRGNEIKAYFDEVLEVSINTQRYIILDDLKDVLPEQEDHFLRIDPIVGITEEDVEKAVNRLVSENRDLMDRIILEESPVGSNLFLPEITSAMRNCQRLAITYQSYDMLTAREFEIEPFALRYFGRRWYVLAHTDFHSSLYLYALDRMKTVETTGKTFKLPANFSAQDHFSHYFGVMITEEKVETICLKTTDLRAKYLRSLPLHHSQKETIPNHFEYRLVPTPDFLNALRAMGTEIEVLRPIWLRKRFLQEAKEMVAKYEKQGL